MLNFFKKRKNNKNTPPPETMQQFMQNNILKLTDNIKNNTLIMNNVTAKLYDNRTRSDWSLPSCIDILFAIINSKDYYTEVKHELYKIIINLYNNLDNKNSPYNGSGEHGEVYTAYGSEFTFHQ